MSTPRFSIALPTKNRSEILPLAIDSVLRQSFADWELVVADNDDTEATREVLNQYRDSRIRYVRTGSLPMWENWEVSLRSTSGDYLLVLEDKVAFKDGAFDYLADFIGNSKASVCSWLIAGPDDFNSSISSGAHRKTAAIEMDSAKLLDSYVLNVNTTDFWVRAPKGLNSVMSRGVYKSIVSKYGAICPKNSPDFTMAYHQLLTASSFYFLKMNLAYRTTSALKYSNGLIGAMRDFKTVDKYFGIRAPNDNMPCKYRSCINSTLSDFWRLNKEESLGYSNSEMSIHNYLLALWDEMVGNKYLLDVNAEKELQEWLDVFVHSDLSVSGMREVQDKCKQIETDRLEIEAEKSVPRFMKSWHWRLKKAVLTVLLWRLQKSAMFHAIDHTNGRDKVGHAC